MAAGSGNAAGQGTEPVVSMGDGSGMGYESGPAYIDRVIFATGHAGGSGGLAVDGRGDGYAAGWGNARYQGIGLGAAEIEGQ